MEVNMFKKIVTILCLCGIMIGLMSLPVMALGISEETTSTYSEENDMPNLIANELIPQFTHGLYYAEDVPHPFLEKAYPYNQINEKLLYAFGADGQQLRYFLDDDIDNVKAFLKENSIDVKVFLKEHFCKVKVNIGLQTKVVYMTMEPTKDQKAFLKSNAVGTTMINVSGNEMTVGETYMVILLLVNSVFLGAMFYFFIWKKRDELLPKQKQPHECHCDKCHEEECHEELAQEILSYEEEQLFVPDEL
jgi:hypothetical protein